MPSTAKFDGSYVGQKGNRGAPLRNSELFIHSSPYLDRISPLTSLSLVLSFSFLDRRSGRHRDDGYLPPFLPRAIYRGLISIATSGESYGYTSPILDSPSLRSCLLLLAPVAPFDPNICSAQLFAGPVRFLLFSATSSPSSPVCLRRRLSCILTGVL